MKTILLFAALALLAVSCSKSDTTSDPVADLSTQNNMVTQSNWTIVKYTDSGNDETSDYSGYTFKFDPNGRFIAVSPEGTFSGTWLLGAGSTTPDDSGNDATDDKFSKLAISIAGSKQMDHLSHKWLAEKITATEIWLRDDNIASNEILRFGK